jgi:hypothetical protein
MRKLMLVLILAAAATGCRERADMDAADRVVVPKATEATETADEDFEVSRTTYQVQARDRLARIDARLRELSARGEAKAEAAAQELRVQRDRLAAELDRAGDQAKPHWDRFETRMRRAFDDLENRIDAAFSRDD